MAKNPLKKPDNRQNRDLLLILIGTVVMMLALAYASVPLYKIFCQRTGFGGTPKIAYHGSDRVLDRNLTVRFVANLQRSLPWEFHPLQHTKVVKLGANGLAFYFAKNNANRPIKAMATYNVSPDVAGQYFNKIECFCFEEQFFDPGQGTEFPVLFFIDPAFDEDPLLKDIKEITLSYTFFELKK